MRLSWPVALLGTGIAIPKTVITNDDLSRRLDTNDEWIVSRTGIRQRRALAPDEGTLSLCLAASRAALDAAQVTPEEIDLVIVCTFTPEHPLPATACELQAALKCRWVPAFDLAAACSGFMWGYVTASQYVVTGMARTVLVVGCDALSRITDPEDRATAILFGDGAGAAVLRRAEPGDPRAVLAARMGADGARGDLIWVPAGGSKEPASLRTVNERLHYVRMRGREVYKFAVTQFQSLISDTLADAGATIDDLAIIIPHQSNLRIIESACEKAGLPRDKMFINIDRYGNTSAASVPIALHEAIAAGRVRRGDLVLMVAFGAGLTWGSIVMRY